MQNNSFLTNNESPLPLYHRLYVILKEQIMDGNYVPGTNLPSEAELTKQYGVSRITAKRALDELAIDGLVQRSRGKGTIVKENAEPNFMQTPVHANIQGLMTNLDNIKHNTTIELKSFGYKEASLWVCRQLHLPANSVVQKAVRLRFYKGEPFSKSTSYVLEKIGRTYNEGDMKSTALVDLLQKSGNAITHVEQAITCTLANDNNAQDLQVLVGSPLLKLRRVFFNKNGEAVNYSEILYSPDRFEYTMSLDVEHS